MTGSIFDHAIFDFDGVLADSFTCACEELNAIADQHYQSIPTVSDHEDLTRVFSGPLRTCLRRFGLTDAESRDFFDRHSAAMQRRASFIRPFTEVVQVIAKLLPGRCSIVTSAYSDAVRVILAKSDSHTASLFRFIAGRELKTSKSQKISEILAAVGTSPERAVHIADMVSDIIYSRAVPIRICAVGWGYHPLSYLRAFDPDYSVSTAEGLAEFLKEQFCL